MKKGEISRGSLPFHPKASHKHHHTTPGLREEDSQLWLDPLGWAGLAFPTWGSKEGEPVSGWASSAQRGFCHPGLGTLRAHQQVLLGVGGIKKISGKQNSTDSKRGQLQQRVQGTRGEVSHLMLSVTKNSIYSTVLSVLLSVRSGVFQGQGVVSEPGSGSRAREWFHCPAAAPTESLCSPAAQTRSDSSRPSLKCRLRVLVQKTGKNERKPN